MVVDNQDSLFSHLPPSISVLEPSKGEILVQRAECQCEGLLTETHRNRLQGLILLTCHSAYEWVFQEALQSQIGRGPAFRKL